MRMNHQRGHCQTTAIWRKQVCRYAGIRRPTPLLLNAGSRIAAVGRRGSGHAVAATEIAAYAARRERPLGRTLVQRDVWVKHLRPLWHRDLCLRRQLEPDAEVVCRRVAGDSALGLIGQLVLQASKRR